MNHEDFQQLITQAINKIPEHYRKEIDNVNFFVYDSPTPEQFRKLSIRKGHTLFGLYEGIPLIKRGINYNGALPDRITIFRLPILYSSTTVDEVINKVDSTVWHEIGHYFGLDEAQVRAAEKRIFSKK